MPGEAITNFTLCCPQQAIEEVAGKGAGVVIQPGGYSRPCVKPFFSTGTQKFIRANDIPLANCFGDDEIVRTVDPSDFGILNFPQVRERLYEKSERRRQLRQWPLSSKPHGGPSRNRTGVRGFAVLYVTTPPSGLGCGRRGG